jgi:hypothetical protein
VELKLKLKFCRCLPVVIEMTSIEFVNSMTLMQLTSGWTSREYDLHRKASHDTESEILQERNRFAPFLSSRSNDNAVTTGI